MSLVVACCFGTLAKSVRTIRAKWFLRISGEWQAEQGKYAVKRAAGDPLHAHFPMSAWDPLTLGCNFLPFLLLSSFVYTNSLHNLQSSNVSCSWGLVIWSTLYLYLLIYWTILFFIFFFWVRNRSALCSVRGLQSIWISIWNFGILLQWTCYSSRQSPISGPMFYSTRSLHRRLSKDQHTASASK